MTFGTSDWLTVGSILVAILIGITAIIVTRRSGKRRKKLLLSWEVVQLVPERSRARGLVVSYDSEDLEDPRLVQVILKNVGPSDISSGDFDGDKSLEVQVEGASPGVTPIRHAGEIVDILDIRQLDPDGSDAEVGPTMAGPDFVEIPPRLIRKGESIAIDLLVDGPVHVYLKSPLIDTDLVKPNNTRRTIWSGFVSVLAGASVTGVVLTGLYTKLSKVESR